MKNDGFVNISDVMPYLLKTLAYWSGEDVYKALEKMPIVNANSHIKLRDRYIKKSSIIYYLRKNLAYWGRNDVSCLLERMPTISGLSVKLLKKWL